MKSIFGRINSSYQCIDENLLKKGLSSLSIYSPIEIQFKLLKNAGLGHVTFNTDDQSLFEFDSVCILSDSRIDNKPELLKKLDLTDINSDDEIILNAFKKWSFDCAINLVGDFAFALWDDDKQELFCARDHFGIKPLYYYFDGSTLVISSEIKTILTQTDLHFTIDEQYIADLISIVKSEKDRTTYQQIKKLPPAHYLSFKNNKLEVKEYWKLKPQNTISGNEKQIIDQYKNLLHEAVRCRIVDNKYVGAELSGGIDSSTITAIASQLANLGTFSHAMPEHLLGKIHPFKDEREFINQLTAYCDIKNQYFITSENVGLTDALRQNLLNTNSINQQNFNTFSDQLYQKAHDEKISVLLSGFGGDEVITSKGSSYLEELASLGLWSEIKEDLKSQRKGSIQTYKTLFKLYLKTKTPGLFKFISLLMQKKPWWAGKFENLALNSAFSKKMKIQKRHFSQFKKNKNLSLQEKSIEQITHQHVSQRLEYCSTATRKFGIEYRYPFLDKRLIEFYLSMPARLKAKNGVGRYAIRMAIEGLVPETIQWRDDKSGATIPTVFMRMLKDKEKIAEIITRAKSNELIKKYINLDEYEIWFKKSLQRSEKRQANINPGAFYNYLKLILFIEQNPDLFK